MVEIVLWLFLVLMPGSNDPSLAITPTEEACTRTARDARVEGGTTSQCIPVRFVLRTTTPI